VGRLQLDLRRGVALGSQAITVPWILAAVLLCVFAITLVLTIRRRTRPGAEPKRSPGPYWPLAIGAMAVTLGYDLWRQVSAESLDPARLFMKVGVLVATIILWRTYALRRRD
jgi:Na+-transporting NADH:ubiquinone oxidoreductase subunit NqrB